MDVSGPFKVSRTLYLLKSYRGLSLYSTAVAAVYRAVGADLVAAIPQRAPGHKK